MADSTLASSSTPFVPVPDAAPGTFAYSRRDPSLTGLVYTVMVSTDLGFWRAAENPDITVGPVDPESKVQIVTVGISEAPVDGRLYCRVMAAP